MPTRSSRGRGQFEAEIMVVLRASSDTPLSARQISDALPGTTPSLPPLFTALGRLERKGEIVRTAGDGRGVRFRAVHDEVEHASRSMIDALRESADRGAALLHFADELSGEDRELLSRAIQRAGRSRRTSP